LKHIVGFSGGADSQATALWVRQRFPAEDIILLNTNAGGNEHPITDWFIQDYSEKVFPVTVIKPLIRDLGGVGTKDGATGRRRAEFQPDDELTFDRLAYIKGRFPGNTSRFCTEYLKLAPQKRWMEENLAGVEVERYVGVRRDESRARSTAACEQYDDYFLCKLHRPIVEWTKPQVFDFLKEHGEEVNPLYKMGFGRVGCAPCILSGKQDIRLWAARFPEMIDKIRVWEKDTGLTFFYPKVPGMKLNWIDDVVAWSRTERGGKQLSLPLVEEEVAAGGCMSQWGLCE
jgi:3'-phosphoadenosine 5'-phosphosulfate sulfotransferase (PAPS reductase)/FAD synthetase